jgi:hypothetical protein
LYRMSEYSGFILVDRNTLGPWIFVGCHMMSENSGVGFHVNYKKGCTRLAGASDKVYQLLANGLWFSPGTPASSTTKTGCHMIVVR